MLPEQCFLKTYFLDTFSVKFLTHIYPGNKKPGTHSHGLRQGPRFLKYVVGENP